MSPLMPILEGPKQEEDKIGWKMNKSKWLGSSVAMTLFACSSTEHEPTERWPVEEPKDSLATTPFEGRQVLDDVVVFHSGKDSPHFGHGPYRNRRTCGGTEIIIDLQFEKGVFVVVPKSLTHTGFRHALEIAGAIQDGQWTWETPIGVSFADSSYISLTEWNEGPSIQLLSYPYNPSPTAPPAPESFALYCPPPPEAFAESMERPPQKIEIEVWQGDMTTVIQLELKEVSPNLPQRSFVYQESP